MPVRTALVGYGTETGNAYDYAEELGRLLERIHFQTRVSKLDAIDSSHLRKSTIVIIVVSTTGQGDLPVNARLFWRSLLRKKLPPSYLDGVQLSIFGLGDSSYPKFNWAARKLHKRLLQLGANEIYPRGEADEQHEEGLDAKFVPWSVDFRKHLLSVFPLPEGVLPIPQDEFLKPKWRLELKQESSADANSFVIGGHNESPSRNSTPCPVVNPTPSYSITDSSFQRLSVNLIENQRTTPDDHWQDVRHLAFNCNHQVDYEPGDVMTIYPENHPDDVEQILNRMRWTDVADKPLEFSPNDNEETDMLQVPPPISFINPNTTLRTLLTNHLDLTAIPRRSFFSLLAHFTDDQFHKDRLLEFTKPEYLDELFDYTTRPRRSILEVLQEFESVSIPWQWAATVIPELRGRQFSIASGGRLKRSASGDTRIELLVAIVRYKTVIKKIRQGVCTRYLASLKPPTRLQVTLQKGGLAISKKEATRPVIMVGPGTGIAPMRSLLWERHHWSQAGLIDGAHTNGSSYRGDNLLFFGCRNERADYFYRAEWEIIKQQMPLQVHAAFSRDQQQKSYVQGLIREQSDSVYRLLEQNCLVYVCGSSGKMPQAVRAALVDVFVLNGLARAAAEQYLERMEKEGRYKQETW